jgi:large subunit ribosomal protein L16
MFQPKKTKYKKYQKGRLKLKTNSLLSLNFGSFGLKSLESGCIKSSQIEAVRRNIKRKIKKFGKIWINIFPNFPITSKPSEVRMGKGKGNVNYWVSKISPGQILFEVSGQDQQLIKDSLKSASNKLSVKTFIIKR